MRPRLPKPLHRAALKLASRLRDGWRRIAKPHLRGVSIVLHDGDGRVLLVRHSYGPDQWALPGGGVKRGEEPRAAAKREIAEELALELTGPELIATLEEPVSGTRHTAYLFTAEAAGEPQVDEREIAAARWFDPQALPDETGELARRHVALWQRHRADF